MTGETKDEHKLPHERYDPRAFRDEIRNVLSQTKYPGGVHTLERVLRSQNLPDVDVATHLFVSRVYGELNPNFDIPRNLIADIDACTDAANHITDIYNTTNRDHVGMIDQRVHAIAKRLVDIVLAKNDPKQASIYRNYYYFWPLMHTAYTVPDKEQPHLKRWADIHNLVSVALERSFMEQLVLRYAMHDSPAVCKQLDEDYKLHHKMFERIFEPDGLANRDVLKTTWSDLMKDKKRRRVDEDFSSFKVVLTNMWIGLSHLGLPQALSETPDLPALAADDWHRIGDFYAELLHRRTNDVEPVAIDLGDGGNQAFAPYTLFIDKLSRVTPGNFDTLATILVLKKSEAWVFFKTRSSEFGHKDSGEKIPLIVDHGTHLRISDRGDLSFFHGAHAGYSDSLRAMLGAETHEILRAHILYYLAQLTVTDYQIAPPATVIQRAIIGSKEILPPKGLQRILKLPRTPRTIYFLDHAKIRVTDGEETALERAMRKIPDAHVRLLPSGMKPGFAKFAEARQQQPPEELYAVVIDPNDPSFTADDGTIRPKYKEAFLITHPDIPSHEQAYAEFLQLADLTMVEYQAPFVVRYMTYVHSAKLDTEQTREPRIAKVQSLTRAHIEKALARKISE